MKNGHNIGANGSSAKAPSTFTIRMLNPYLRNS
eukprot:CAMPEP_0174723006 /NCGR_PEP_ID=MMETSP1094-20130205/39802_1 /TAXON_ID=156173 /ORGANISM="Chrysochromulina brevifilum, Strain UTEX LB 985" /LENGTH=32 /DNA_ID= /DNA_START= /DNA_END= /DNA_ORIENTATION=